MHALQAFSPSWTDLSDPAQIPQLAQRALELLGHVDVLVNNAACSYIDLFQCMPPERIRELYAVNLTAVVELTRALLPSMLSRHSGCIINISSVWGETGASCEVDYAVTKGAVLALTRALAKEVVAVRHSGKRRFAGDDPHRHDRPSPAGNAGGTGGGNAAGAERHTGGCGGGSALSRL